MLYFDEICHASENVIQLDEARLPEKYQGKSPKVRDINEYAALMERKRIMIDTKAMKDHAASLGLTNTKNTLEKLLRAAETSNPTYIEF